ncbi:hypothetical protein EDD11_006257 [Mortierella claussenii]|nr:hypothetical protein EDD11_006257 [Mortierella claussenii]
MVLKSTFTVLMVATLAVFSSYAPQAEAHSWADCIDWKFNKKGSNDWSDKGGKCLGYARRFPLHSKPFGKLDSADPNRHYQQSHNNPDSQPPCSNGKAGAEPGAIETRGNPVSSAYGGKWGRMTVTSVGDTLCVRWPAKNHAIESGVPKVNIYLSKVRNGKDISQRDLLKQHIASLPYQNCNKAKNQDIRPCGGCFKVPQRASGTYLLQWRWMLNKNEYYTSCADVQIGKSK